MKRLRVLVANRPRLMRELVLTVIADQPDIEVIGVVVCERSLALFIGKQPSSSRLLLPEKL